MAKVREEIDMRYCWRTFVDGMVSLVAGQETAWNKVRRVSSIDADSHSKVTLLSRSEPTGVVADALKNASR